MQGFEHAASFLRDLAGPGADTQAGRLSRDFLELLAARPGDAREQEALARMRTGSHTMASALVGTTVR